MSMGLRVAKATTPGKWIVYAHHKGIRRNQTFNSKEEAEELARKIRLRIELGESLGLRRLAKGKPSNSAPKIKDFGKRWIAERERSNLKANTVRIYRSIWNRHLLPHRKNRVLIFRSRRGKELRYQNFYKRWKEILEESGLEYR